MEVCRGRFCLGIPIWVHDEWEEEVDDLLPVRRDLLHQLFGCSQHPHSPQRIRIRVTIRRPPLEYRCLCPQSCADIHVDEDVDTRSFELSPILTVVVEQHDVHGSQCVFYILTVDVQGAYCGNGGGELAELIEVVTPRWGEVAAGYCGRVESMAKGGRPSGGALVAVECIFQEATSRLESEKIIRRE